MIKKIWDKICGIGRWIKEKWKEIFATGIILTASATIPITPNEIAWKDFTDNLIAIEYQYIGEKDLKGIWQPTEKEFEEVYKYAYGFDLVAWQTVDGVEMCPRMVREDNSLGGYTACLSHWEQEFNNSKEQGELSGNIIIGLRNGVRQNIVNSDLYNIQSISVKKQKFNLLRLFRNLILSVYAGVEFEDHFVDSPNTALKDWIPDTTGTGYTDLITTGSCDLYVSNADRIDGTASISLGGCGANEGELCETDDTMSHADYEVSITQINGDTGDDSSAICGRIQDANNMYCLVFNEGSGGPAGDIYENVGGSWAIIEANCGNIADGSKVELKFVGTTISVEDDDIEICSVVDDSHSSAGKAGIGMGDIGANVGADVSDQDLDNFIVNVTGVAAPTRRIMIIE